MIELFFIRHPPHRCGWASTPASLTNDNVRLEEVSARLAVLIQHLLREGRTEVETITKKERRKPQRNSKWIDDHHNGRIGDPEPALGAPLATFHTNN